MYLKMEVRSTSASRPDDDSIRASGKDLESGADHRVAELWVGATLNARQRGEASRQLEHKDHRGGSHRRIFGRTGRGEQ